jgi:hypothetical protein
MAEHFCGEHQKEYFKKGNMKGYAHPVGDGTWCNEHKPESETIKSQVVTPTAPPVAPVVHTPDYYKNRAMALSYSKDLVAAGIYEVGLIYNYADKFLEYLNK